MPLANGLASAVDTFVAVRNENRRSQLHDLKIEGAGLVNEGRRMDNTFARESYGARLRQEQGAAEWQTGRGRVAQSQARTDEQIEDEGLLVRQERQKTRYEGNRANYWDSRSVSAASDARVSSNTEQARIDTQRSKADKAFQDASSAARGNREGVVKGLRAELNNVVGNRPLSEAVRDERFQANVVPLLEIEYEDYLSPGQTIEGLVSMGPGQFGIAARMPDGSIQPITTDRSADPEDSVLVISEDEVAAFVLGAGAEDYRSFQAGGDILREEVAGQLGGTLSALDREREGQTVALEAADERFASAQEVQAELESLRLERDSVESYRNNTNFGYNDTAGRGLVSEVDQRLKRRAADAAIAEVDQRIEALTQDAEAQGLIDYSLEDHVEARGDALSRLGGEGNPGPRIPSSIGGIGREENAAIEKAEQTLSTGLREATASDRNPGEVADEVKETGVPGQSAVDRASGAEAANRLRIASSAPVTDVVDKAIGSLDPSLLESEEEYGFSTGSLEGDMLTLFSDNPELRRMALEDPVRARAFATVVANDMLRAGEDQGTATWVFQGDMGGDPVVAYELMGSSALKSLGDFEKYLVANYATVMIKQGTSEGQAKAQALFAFRNGKLRTQEDLTRLAGANKASLRNLRN